MSEVNLTTGIRVEADLREIHTLPQAKPEVMADAHPSPSEIPMPELTPEQNILDALKLLGFKPTEENLQIAKNLLENGIPVTDTNIRSLLQAVRLTGNMEQAIFMLQNSIPVNTKTAELVKGFSSNELQILALVEEIVSIVENMPEGAQKQKLLSVLSGQEALQEERVPEAKPQDERLSDAREARVAGQETSEKLPTVVKTTPAAQTANATQQATTATTSTTSNTTITINTANTTITDTAQHQNTTIPETAEAMTSPSKSPAAALPEAPAAVNAPQIHAAPAVPEQVQSNAAPVQPSVEASIAQIPTEEANILQQPVESQKQPAEMQVMEKISNESSNQNINQNPYQNAEKSALLGRVLERIGLNPQTDDRESLNTRLNTLQDIISELSREAVDNPRFADILDRLERSLNFFCDVRRLAYMQVPLWNGETARNMGLYVFQNKQKKSSRQGKQSALLSLDFAALGHVEAYIQKHGNGVNIRFKTDLGVRNVIWGNMAELGSLLASKGYRLDSYTFAHNNVPFGLADNEPGDIPDAGKIKITNVDVKA